jgi:hypothetical protein
MSEVLSESLTAGVDVWKVWSKAEIPTKILDFENIISLSDDTSNILLLT